MENETQTNNKTKEDQAEKITENQSMDIQVHKGDIRINGGHSGIYNLVVIGKSIPELKSVEVHRNDKKYIDRNVVLDPDKDYRKQVEEKVRAMIGDEELVEGKCECRIHRS